MKQPYILPKKLDFRYSLPVIYKCNDSCHSLKQELNDACTLPEQTKPSKLGKIVASGLRMGNPYLVSLSLDLLKMTSNVDKEQIDRVKTLLSLCVKEIKINRDLKDVIIKYMDGHKRKV